ncbi:MAG: stage V sporulation protein S [Anaerolineaceae bacterium]|nr:MAG: stage V sporulation protein S [Anaerolineaceae bacterium]
MARGCRARGLWRQPIGAGAVNWAIRAPLNAKGYLAEEDKEIVFVPSMAEVKIDGGVRTAARLDS